MTTYTPDRRIRLLAAGLATVALALTATMAVSYARPLGQAGYGGHQILGGYGGYGHSASGR